MDRISEIRFCDTRNNNARNESNEMKVECGFSSLLAKIFRKSLLATWQVNKFPSS